MDKTKKMILRMAAVFGLLFYAGLANAQDVSKIQFCDRKYEYEVGNDSVTLFFNLIDQFGNRIQDVTVKDFRRYLTVKEDGEEIKKTKFSILNSGQRIPSEYTFSVLVDLSIPESGKEHIFEAVKYLIESAPDSCVYLSFFGDNVTSSVAVNKDNYDSMKDKFLVQAENKYFFSALYAKLIEFSDADTEDVDGIEFEEGYIKNPDIASRAAKNEDKNILFVFVDGHEKPSSEPNLTAMTIRDTFRSQLIAPRVMALYYTEEAVSETGGGQELIGMQNTLKFVCTPKDAKGNIIEDKRGEYMSANDIEHVVEGFEKVVSDAMYDYALTYKVDESRNYSGIVGYSAEWGKERIGECEYSIGSAERPWPLRVEEAGDVALKYLYALLITLGTILFFYAIAKILIPYIRQKSFAFKYYKKYEPEENVSRRICHYCKQDIQPGQTVVTKCKHIMHLHCWKQNGYKCAEYGQNCKTGIQSRVDWKGLFSFSSFKECYQTISGILAGFISWVIYEFFGRGFFNGLSESLVNLFYSDKEGTTTMFQECVGKTSAFLTIGLLLGFFLSFIFRYNDEYKSKDLKVWCKILGLSLLTGAIGMLAFAVGSYLLCLLLSSAGTTYIPWYCSLPAYLLFSISVSLALTIKSTIPVKSALLGSLCSAIIGFAVLYFSSMVKGMSGWMNMLLDFIIYGGGLGASLVTVRMLAERYFLVIQNGVRAGQRIPIHKWMNATGGGNKVSIGMTGECEIQMNWEKSNKVAKEHVQLFIDYDKQLPMLKPLATGVIFNTRAELPVGRPTVLSNGDNFKIGDTIFQYQETE